MSARIFRSNCQYQDLVTVASKPTSQASASFSGSKLTKLTLHGPDHGNLLTRSMLLNICPCPKHFVHVLLAFEESMDDNFRGLWGPLISRWRQASSSEKKDKPAAGPAGGAPERATRRPRSSLEIWKGCRHAGFEACFRGGCVAVRVLKNTPTLPSSTCASGRISGQHMCSSTPAS